MNVLEDYVLENTSVDTIEKWTHKKAKKLNKKAKPTRGKNTLDNWKVVRMICSTLIGSFSVFSESWQAGNAEGDDEPHHRHHQQGTDHVWAVLLYLPCSGCWPTKLVLSWNWWGDYQALAKGRY